jgi:hypothetical protein
MGGVFAGTALWAAYALLLMGGQSSRAHAAEATPRATMPAAAGDPLSGNGLFEPMSMGCTPPLRNGAAHGEQRMLPSRF